MIADALKTRVTAGREEALVDAYTQLLGVKLNAEQRRAFAADVADLLKNAASIQPFQNGKWRIWLQGGAGRSRRDGLPDAKAVQFVAERGGFKTLESSDYATHVTSEPSSGFLVTLSFHARQRPLPEATDISHPRWEVEDVEERPTESHFDLNWKDPVK